MRRFLAFLRRLFGRTPAPLPIRGQVGSHQLDPQSLQQLTELGATHTRFTYYWALSLIDADYHARWVADVKRAQAAGLAVLVVFHQEPGHLKALPFAARLNSALAKMLEVASAVPFIYLQPFNEIDGEAFDTLFLTWADNRDIGSRYGAFLKSAYPSLRPLVRGIVTSGINTDVREFYEGMLAHVRGLDLIGGVHCYGYPVSLHWKAHYDSIRASGWTGPVWCTEIGMDDGQIAPGHYPEITQAVADQVQLDTLRDCLTANPGYAQAFLYVLTEGVVPNEKGFALTMNDRSYRPFAQWLIDHNWTVAR